MTGAERVAGAAPADSLVVGLVATCSATVTRADGSTDDESEG